MIIGVKEVGRGVSIQDVDFFHLVKADGNIKIFTGFNGEPKYCQEVGDDFCLFSRGNKVETFESWEQEVVMNLMLGSTICFLVDYENKTIDYSTV